MNFIDAAVAAADIPTNTSGMQNRLGLVMFTASLLAFPALQNGNNCAMEKQA